MNKEFSTFADGSDCKECVAAERKIKHLTARLAAAEAAMQRQLEITYQYREQRDKAYGCVRNAIPGDYSTDSIDSDMGRMFQETIQKVMKRSDELQERLTAAEYALKKSRIETEAWMEIANDSHPVDRAGNDIWCVADNGSTVYLVRRDALVEVQERLAAAEEANERMTNALKVIADWRGMLAWNRDLRAIAKAAIEAAKGGCDE